MQFTIQKFWIVIVSKRSRRFHVHWGVEQLETASKCPLLSPIGRLRHVMQRNTFPGHKFLATQGNVAATSTILISLYIVKVTPFIWKLGIPTQKFFALLKSLFFLCFPDSLRETGMTSMADLDSSSLLLASRRTSAKVRSLEKMVAEMLLLPCFSKDVAEPSRD